MNYLSKTDFKTARDCATKLYYKKLRYPSTLDDDPYMQMLADGGFMVGKFAQLLFPDGVEVLERDPMAAIEATARLIQQEEFTLFEPALVAGHLLARVDVLRRKGQVVELIEVKSGAFDPEKGFRGKRGHIRGEMREYIEDIAFQKLVARSVFPEAEIRCFLMAPDTSARSEIDGLPGQFAITHVKRSVSVEFRGDLVELRKSKLLRMVSLDPEVDEVLGEVQAAIDEMLPLITDGPKRASPTIGYHCKGCLYRTNPDTEPNGFRECWGALADVRPSIFDLFQLGNLRGADRKPLADDLIAQGKFSLYDIPDGALKGAYEERQRVQIQHSRSKTEWRSDGLRPILEGLEYPLHFIDFETSRLAIPYHRGMRPFEQVAFQWSCHTIDEPGGDLRHSEWINVETSFPNFEFAEELRAAVGDDGTLLTWSHHEASVLRDIARQATDYERERTELADWLTATAERRVFDLCKHAGGHFFHHEMGGRTSIKFVLPAVWRSNTALHEDPWFSDYFREENGVILDPYKTLPPLELFEQAEVVDEGTGAMRAYQEMLYSAGRIDPAIHEAWKALLLQHCKLDTLAMVIIWKHWMGGRG